MIKKHNPLLLPTFLFIAGLLLGYTIYIKTFHLLISSAFCFCIYLFITRKHIKSISLLVLFFLLGATIISLNDFNLNSSHFAKKNSNSVDVVITKIEKTSKGKRYFAKAKVCENKLAQSCNGKLIIYSDSTINLKLFNTYQIPSSFRKINTFKNPDRFDYGRYLGNQDIYHSTYIRSQPQETEQCNAVLRIARECRIKASQFFSENLSNQDVTSVVNAIVVGEKTEMDSELKNLFINNGLAHLLAISGMHVGIVLLIIKFFTGRLPSHFVKAIIILGGIWFYILLTGLQIPAIRAGFMFTVFVLGQILDRNTKGLNSIFFAALVLLSIQPKLILQLSFQLSFTAMISILLFYKPIVDLLSVKNLVASTIWQLIALNLSVQILVLPLSIFYFQQIPTYSILTSIVSTPFILLIMWGAMMAFATSYFDIISSFICNILDTILSIYINLLQVLSNLPNALLIDVHIDVFQVILWIVGSIVLLFLFQKHSLNLTLSLACFGPLLIVSSLLNVYHANKSQLTVYDDDKQIIIGYQTAKQDLLYKQFPEIFSYPVEGNLNRKTSILPLQNVMEIEGISIAIIKDSNNALPRKQVIDFCVVTSSESIPYAKSFCKKIIVPRTIKQANPSDNIHFIEHEGAYSLKLKTIQL